MKKLLLLYTLIFALLTTAQSQELQTQIYGKGPNLIFIPGLASSGEVWEETVAQLSSNYECHVLTLPGFGTNPATEMPEGFLETMEKLLSEYILEQKEKVTLIGHSLGGFLSLRLSRSIPEHIQKAIIVDSFPFYSAAFNPAATEENMVGMASQMKQLMLSQSPEQYLTQQKSTMPMMTINVEKLPLAVEWSMQSDRNTTAVALYELMTTDFRDELTEVKTPILVLGAWASGKNYGLTEESVKKTFSDQYQLAENVQIEMAPTAHHFIMWDNPEWFMEKLSAFLQ
ncbi:alpha/beta fold hydrolase [Algoriphagus taiwanensis]|uniref:Alpha/beta hydrolase n=1 Tax=Algoriphagus taiwanensis TaxID=1445656 RepID=A0ABQ6Q5W7_9BACT|nr:alpha/beta hydrolase [Algoriphagus taiwanensis]